MIRRAGIALMGMLLHGLSCGVGCLHAQEAAVADAPRAAAYRLVPTERERPHPFSATEFPSYRRPRIGLVLSGGGARGLAQLGVLRALDEAGIRPDFIAGTSIGSIIGGLYAAGYSTRRLEQTIRTIDWDDLLQLTNPSGRDDLFVDQKPVSDRSIVTLRFDGLRPVLPLAVSNGQRLTNLLNSLALDAIYHSRSFEQLGIPFRAVATDLYTGARVVLDSGSLSEAMRASATVPVLYAPVLRDSMALIDGGINANIPVDIARSWGCDLVIAVNTTSPPRRSAQITNPLETLDQVLNLLMERGNAEQLQHADVVITPSIGDHLATDFRDVDSLIAMGYRQAVHMLPAILRARRELFARALADSATGLLRSASPPVRFPDAVLDTLARLLTTSHSAAIDVSPSSAARSGWRVSAKLLPRLRSVVITGASKELLRTLESETEGVLSRPFNATVVRDVCERVLTVYRSRGYALAGIASLEIDTGAGMLRMHLDEGRIGSVSVVGNSRTNAVVILREFPLQTGHLFRTEDALDGMTNITALNLFHQVSFQILDESRDPAIVIRVEERPSQVLQISTLVDDERNAQLALELRDMNLFGTGTELSGLFFGGFENRRYAVRYNTNRMWYTNLGMTLETYYDLRDFNSYRERTDLPFNRFSREIDLRLRRILYGAQATLGLYTGRFGNVTGNLTIEQQELNTVQRLTETAAALHEAQRIVSFGFGTTIDTKDRYPYPRKGMFLQIAYTSAQAALGSEVPFSRVKAEYDVFISSANETWTAHPRLLFGYGDKTMPRTEDFRLGGLSTFYGMREGEFTGQQLFVGSLELRARLPIRFLFESYLSFRYDIGRTWEIPEQIKFGDLRHGAGLALCLDTPIGPADLAIGKSFLFLTQNGATYTKWGPANLYFSIGVGL